MKLETIFSKAKINSLGGLEFCGISDDSRLTREGELFFIIPREHFDIFAVLREVEPKVAAFIAQRSQAAKLKDIIKHKPIIYVEDIQKEFRRIVDRFYEFNNDQLKIIGVTGTNGKTTTTTLIYHLLRKLGLAASLIGTVNYLIGSEVYEGENTTPGFLRLRKLIKQAKDSGSKFLVLEVSSHAIQQGRIAGIEFDRCLFTNLGRDHLDYHRTMDDYFKVKKKLFLDNKKGTALINIDDSYGIKLFRSLGRGLTFGTKEISDFKISKINLAKQGSCFDIEHSNRVYSIKTKACGKHNVYNATASFALIVSLGLPADEAAEQIASFSNVEGRLELVGENIFIDYAHTPDALETALSALRNIGYQRIICVFGCGGDRDQGKRQLMGQVADRWVDFSFLTADNPRSEDAEVICRQIEEGFSGENYAVVVDRGKAIEEAISLLAKQRAHSASGHNSCLLIAGKGHEGYQIIGSTKLPFKDSELVRKLIKKAHVN